MPNCPTVAGVAAAAAHVWLHEPTEHTGLIKRLPLALRLLLELCALIAGPERISKCVEVVFAILQGRRVARRPLKAAMPHVCRKLLHLPWQALQGLVLLFCGLGDPGFQTPSPKSRTAPSREAGTQTLPGPSEPTRNKGEKELSGREARGRRWA